MERWVRYTNSISKKIGWVNMNKIVDITETEYGTTLYSGNISYYVSEKIPLVFHIHAEEGLSHFIGPQADFIKEGSH